MKAVLISIQPKWCQLITRGQKTLEIRKTRPKLETPFKCYIYMTSGRWAWRDPFATAVIPPSGKMYNGAQTVIGEFTCDRISIFRPKSITLEHEFKKRSCLTVQELIDYADTKDEHIYAWSISSLIVYDKPRPVQDFKQCHRCPYGDFQNCLQHEYSCAGYYKLTRPPQSWCYVEEL